MHPEDGTLASMSEVAYRLGEEPISLFDRVAIEEESLFEITIRPKLHKL